MPLKQPLYKKQYIVTVEGIASTFFQKCSAPSITADKVKYNDGQTGIERTHLGFTATNEVTLSKVTDAETDAALVSFCMDRLAGKGDNAPFTVTIQPVKTDVAGTPVGGGIRIQLIGCQVSKLELMEADRSATDMSMITIELVFDQFTTQ